MKIVCDSCGAKYSIADEKVAGKVFKIRCKRCSQVIVVKGTDDAPAAAAAAEAPAGDGADGAGVWYVVVDGEQQGPMTAAQISELLSAGRIDWEAYTWRETLDGWKPLREIQELVDEISPPAAAAPAPEPAAPPMPAARAAPAPAADPFAPVGGGLFGAPAPAADSGGLFGSPAPAAAASRAARAPVASQSGGRAGGGVDLFAAAQASAIPAGAAPEEDDVVSSSGGGGLGMAAGGDPSMVGQRNENSVLFSLSNLQALAGGPAKPKAETTTGAVKSATSEASGLIDIRALSTSASAQPSGSSGGMDDILSLGGASAFAPTLGAPVLMPAQQSSGGKLVPVLIGIAAILVLGIIALIVFIMMGTEQPVAMTGTTLPDPGMTTAIGATAAPMTAAPMTAGPATAEGGAAAEEEGGRGGAKRPRGGGGGGGGGGAAAPPGGGGGQPATAAPAKTRKGGSDSLDDLLSGALGGGGKAPAKAPPPPAAGGGGPATPSRADISAGMNGVAGAVRACGGGQSGTAMIRVTISNSGRVTNAAVTGPPFAGTPAGSCMARAVRGASFPRFTNPSLTVSYPFTIR